MEKARLVEGFLFFDWSLKFVSFNGFGVVLKHWLVESYGVVKRGNSSESIKNIFTSCGGFSSFDVYQFKC